MLAGAVPSTIRLRRARLKLWGRQEKSCLACVPDRGGIADPEERGQVQGIRTVGQGFLEVAIHAELIERDTAVPKESAEVGAGWAGDRWRSSG